MTVRDPLRRSGMAALALAAVLRCPAIGAADEAPPSYRAEVRLSAAGQDDLVTHKEHCSADPEALRSIGRRPGEQVRIDRDGVGPAAFTVFESRDETPDSIVRMGRAGRLRLGTAEGFPARVVAEVPHPTLDDAGAKRLGECVERGSDDGEAARLLVLAPHGGDIEPQTDRQAERLAEALRARGSRVTTWICKGFKPPGPDSAFDRWHITSTDLSPASYPGLKRLDGRRFDYAVSFHGMSRQAVLIGGAAPIELKREIRAAIATAIEGSDIPVIIAAEGDSLGGSSPRNVVNRYGRANGIQIEQSSRARRDHWKAIADAVADVYADRLARASGAKSG